MTFYRVSYSQDGGNSAGYSWHTNRREAVRVARKAYNEDPAEYDHIAGTIKDRIETIVVTPTRAGILDALKRYASHPDNG
jgi:hypothetical protein